MDVQLNNPAASGRGALAASEKIEASSAQRGEGSASTANAEGPILTGPGLTVLPQEIMEGHYEAMKAVADNLKPSEKERKLRAERKKEVRAAEEEKERREKEDLAADLEKQRIAALNRA